MPHSPSYTRVGGDCGIRCLDLIPIDGTLNIQERDLLMHGFRVFLRRARVEYDDALVRPDIAAPKQQIERPQAHGRLGAERQSFEADRLFHPRLDEALRTTKRVPP